MAEKPTAVKDIREGPISDFGDCVLGRSFVGTSYENDRGEEVVDVYTFLTDHMIKLKKLDVDKECVDEKGKPKLRTSIFKRTYKAEYVLPPQDFMYPNSGRVDRKRRILCGFNEESTPLTRLFDELMYKIKILENTNVALRREIIGLTAENEVLRTNFWAKYAEVQKAAKAFYIPPEDGEEHARR